MTTGIPTLLPERPVIAPHTPDIWCAVNPGFNSALDADMDSGKYYAMVKRYVVPAHAAGATHCLIRAMEWPRAWLASINDAFQNLCPKCVPVLYINPRDSKWDLGQTYQASMWREMGGKIIVEQHPEYMWVPGLLRADAVEPAVATSNTPLHGFPVIIEDGEWQRRTAQNWRDQIPPWKMSAGFVRWHSYGVFDGGLTVLEGVRAHYAECRTHLSCLAQAVAADLFLPVGAGGHGLTADAIRGAATSVVGVGITPIDVGGVGRG